jgi:hypothetical protein
MDSGLALRAPRKYVSLILSSGALCADPLARNDSRKKAPANAGAFQINPLP